MDAATLDRELGTLVRRAINSGLEPVIVSGILVQNMFEVANHIRIRSEQMVIREALGTANPKGNSKPRLQGN
jgi:hypothetical protein